MKQYVFTWMVLLFLPLDIIEAKNEWDLIKDESGIEIYSKSGSDPEYIEIKGVSQVKSNLKAFVALMQDVNDFKQWMHAAKETSLISKNNDYHFSYYMHSDIPWPAKDRDVVLNLKIFRNSKNGTIYTKTRNITGVIPEKENIQRIASVKSSWKFVPLGEDKIRIIFKTRIKPGIQLPQWLAERIYQLGPYHTIKNMKEMVKKTKYQSANIELSRIHTENTL
jgi:hypothetical protein